MKNSVCKNSPNLVTLALRVGKSYQALTSTYTLHRINPPSYPFLISLHSGDLCYDFKNISTKMIGEFD
jgi:hypothetical protein